MKNTLIVISGPTASGKTSLAMELAGKEKLDIISADSRQVYKYMDIGTAKPAEEELSEVKHHLIDIIEPDSQYNAGTFLRDSRKIIEDYIKEGRKLPLMVGGTGLYIKSFLEGLAPVPDVPEEVVERLKKNREIEGTEKLYERLKEVDPGHAGKLHRNDTQRVIRFLSIYEHTGKPFSYWQSIQDKPEYPFRIVYFILFREREELYERINRRVDIMLERGLIEEVEGILKKGYDSKAPGLRTFGYQEIIEYLENKVTREEAIGLIKQNTRNFAKRQITWFKKVEGAIFLEPSTANMENLMNHIKEP